MSLQSILKVNQNSKYCGCFVVFRSVGAGYVSASLANEMGLKHGSFIDVVEDDVNPGDYYLRRSEDGLKIKCYVGNRNTYQFHARTLARNLGRIFGIMDSMIKIKVGPKIKIDGIDAWPMITAELKAFKL